MRSLRHLTNILRFGLAFLSLCVLAPTSATSATLPTQPIFTGVTDITTTGGKLTWSTAGSATSFRLDISTTPGFASFVGPYNDLDVGYVQWKIVADLLPGTTYFVRVRGHNDLGSGPNSDVASFITLPAPNFVTTNVTLNRTTVRPGENVVAQFAVSNIGAVNAPASFFAGLIDYTTTSAFGIAPVPALAVGQSYSSATVVTTWSQEGVFRFFGLAEAGGQIAEIDEMDNYLLAGNLTVDGTPPTASWVTPSSGAVVANTVTQIGRAHV
jgi:hypothetical protein